jgi:hypothetical protein
MVFTQTKVRALSRNFSEYALPMATTTVLMGGVSSELLDELH